MAGNRSKLRAARYNPAMCGRFTLRTAMNILLQEFHAELRDEVNLKPRYNVAPTQDVPVIVRGDSGARELTIMRWGLVPHWAKGQKIPLLINARADTVAEKPAFRDAFKRRRGLMLADGFYEWQQPAKQPFYFRRRGGKPFAFAAIWAPANEPGGIGSAALITTEPNEMVAQVHDRMPVLLTADDAPAWLDSTTEDPDKLLPLLRPYEATDMECWPVSKFVSNARNETPECVEPA